MRLVRWACVVIVVAAAVLTAGGARGCRHAALDRELREGGRVRAVIGGEVFRLEAALDEPTRVLGMGGRTRIEPDGGMIFVFPSAGPLEFVMRDCPIDIDIAFLDDAGHAVRIYTMAAEKARRADEPAREYELRLKRYASRFPCRFVVEVAAGTFERLGVRPGDKVEIDLASLKTRAK